MEIPNLKPKFKEGDKVYQPLYQSVEEYTVKELLGIEYLAKRNDMPIIITYLVTNDSGTDVIRLEHELYASKNEALDIISEKFLKGMPSELKGVILDKLLTTED